MAFTDAELWITDKIWPVVVSQIGGICISPRKGGFKKLFRSIMPNSETSSFEIGGDQIPHHLAPKLVKHAFSGRYARTPSISEALAKYLIAYPGIEKNSAHYLFFSTRLSAYNYSKAITRERAWQLISEVCHAVGLSGNYGTHTLRKTWGYHARKNGVPIEIIMAKLNHTSFAFTKRYLGITDDELKAAAEGLNL